MPKDTLESMFAEAFGCMKRLIASESCDPKDVLVEAIKSSQVVGIGEVHTIFSYNPHRQMGIELMKSFAQAGATHLAVELPKTLQPVLDAFNDDEKQGDLVIPATIIDSQGIENRSRAAAGALEFLSRINLWSPEIINMWKAARKNGIKICAIDSDHAGLLMAGIDVSNMMGALSRRDRVIKDNILAILNLAPGSKVIAWLGSLHIAAGTSDQALARSAFEMIKSELAERGEKVTTFFSQIAQGKEALMTTLHPLTNDLEAPVVLPTGNTLGQLPVFAPPYSHPLRFDAFDHVIVYPLQGVA
jgi:hypothetical protein